ncbi:hypothetical protein Bca101_074590 [Brassica carinata]
MQTVLGVVFLNQWSHLLYGLVVGSGSARLYRLVSAREVSTAVEVRPDLVSRQGRLASWLRRGELLVSDGGVWLQWLVLRASMVGVASFNGVVGALLPHVEVKGGDGTGPGSDTCERAEWTVNRSSMAVFTLLSKLQAFLESTSCHRFESFDSVSVCESLSLFLRFSKTARERLSFGLGRGGVALGPSYHPSAGEGSLIHHWFGGGSSELFAWLGGGFKRCVTLRTTRALVCYSGDDPRNPGIRGNKENLTFSGLSSIVENTNQFLRNFERRTSGMYRI